MMCQKGRHDNQNDYAHAHTTNKETHPTAKGAIGGKESLGMC